VSAYSPLYEEGERPIGRKFQAIVRNHLGEIVYACDHPHPYWEDAADCAHIWVLAKAQEEGLMPRKR
jgi:predicted HD phosphohydrolase